MPRTQFVPMNFTKLPTSALIMAEELTSRCFDSEKVYTSPTRDEWNSYFAAHRHLIPLSLEVRYHSNLRGRTRVTQAEQGTFARAIRRRIVEWEYEEELKADASKEGHFDPEIGWSPEWFALSRTFIALLLKEFDKQLELEDQEKQRVEEQEMKERVEEGKLQASESDRGSVNNNINMEPAQYVAPDVADVASIATVPRPIYAAITADQFAYNLLNVGTKVYYGSSGSPSVFPSPAAKADQRAERLKRWSRYNESHGYFGNGTWCVKRIIWETDTFYVITWMGINPDSGEEWDYSLIAKSIVKPGKKLDDWNRDRYGAEGVGWDDNRDHGPYKIKRREFNPGGDWLAPYIIDEDPLGYLVAYWQKGGRHDFESYAAFVRTRDVPKELIQSWEEKRGPTDEVTMTASSIPTKNSSAPLSRKRKDTPAAPTTNNKRRKPDVSTNVDEAIEVLSLSNQDESESLTNGNSELENDDEGLDESEREPDQDSHESSGESAEVNDTELGTEGVEQCDSGLVDIESDEDVDVDSEAQSSAASPIITNMTKPTTKSVVIAVAQLPGVDPKIPVETFDAQEQADVASGNYRKLIRRKLLALCLHRGCRHYVDRTERVVKRLTDLDDETNGPHP